MTTRIVFARKVEVSDTPMVTSLKDKIKTRWEAFRLARKGYFRAAAQVKKLLQGEDGTPKDEFAQAKLERDHFEVAMEAARITRELHLAHCYLKGRKYKQCEQKCRVAPEARRVAQHIWGEGSRTLVANKDGETRIEKWLTTEGATHFDIDTCWDELNAVEEAAKKLKAAEHDIEVFHQREQDAYRLAQAAQAAIQENQNRTREIQQSLGALKESLASAEAALKNKKEEGLSSAAPRVV